MEEATSEPGTVCVVCREPLSADGSCLACLLSLGLPQEEPGHARADTASPAAATQTLPVPAAPARCFQHYEVCLRDDGINLYELGRGAMGVTYKARDVNLDVPVALKVISAPLSGHAAARERFRREARATAQLRHPHVASVFHFGETPEGQCFYTMEFIEGETLEERVKREGPLPAALVLEIARQITEALVAADHRGLVHRDLKPGNLMLVAPEPGKEPGTRSGSSVAPPVWIKVIDFGLAKAVSAAAEETTKRLSLTQGAFVGTPHFASPEQVDNSGAVDTRSDIYSLGATLWYLLTAKVPFPGRSLAEIHDRQLHRPLPLGQLAVAGVPAPLAELLKTMLEAAPEKRPASPAAVQGALEKCRDEIGVIATTLRWTDAGYGSARGTAARAGSERRRAAARWLAAAALIFGLGAFAWFQLRHHPAGTPPEQAEATAVALVPAKSIAVLPFENRSDDRENGFFTDGVQDEILTDLARIADLKVISRTSVMQYKAGTPRNLREIAQGLGVAHVLEGSVQRASGKVRVTAQLIDARTAAQLWAQSYDRPLDDAFAIQSEIAGAIAAQLRARISPAEQAALAQAPPTKDVLAFQLYQHARALKGYNSDPTSARRLFEAVDLLGQAVGRDPEFLQAWCLLAEVHLDLYWEGLDRSGTRRESARTASEKAARLAPEAGETHLVRAIYHYHGLSDYRRALDDLALAQRTLPNSVDVPFYTAAIYRRQGRWDESLREFNRAAELDPRNFAVLSETAHTEDAMEHYAAATRRYNQALAVQPSDLYTRERLALIPYFERADVRPLQALNTALLASEPGTAEGSAYFRLLVALAERDSDAARKALADFPARGYQVADFYAPPEWFAGLTARAFGDEAGAQTAFFAARAKVESVVREQPAYAPAWGMLGLIDAGLGRKEDAVREGQRGCELMPPSRDAYNHPNLVGFLAMIYAWTGEKDLALQTLGQVVHARVGISGGAVRYGPLKLDPQWDPLRGDPRFEALVASLAPKL